MQTLFILLVAVVVIGGGAFWYVQNQTTAPVDATIEDPFGTPATTNSNAGVNTAAPTNPSGTAGTPVTAPAVGAVKEFVVTNTGMSFDQKTLSVKKGDTVKVTFQNKGGTHDFVIDEFPGARTKVIQAGQEESVTFVADKAGSFEYYCSVGQHRANGMWGTLTVTE